MDNLETEKTETPDNVPSSQNNNQKTDNVVQISEWKDIKFSSNGPITIDKATGEGIQELYNKKPQLFIDAIDMMDSKIEENDTQNIKIEKKIIEYFKSLPKDKDFKPWDEIGILRETLKLNYDLQAFYNSDKGKGRSNMLLRARTEKGNTDRSFYHLVIINPFYESSMDYTREFRKDLKELAKPSLDKEKEKESFTDFGFSIKINFSKFDKKKKENFDIPKDLRTKRHGFSVPVNISSKNKFNILISLGEESKSKRIEFSFTTSKYVKITLPNKNSFDLKMFNNDSRGSLKVKMPNLDDRNLTNISDIWFPPSNDPASLPDITVIKLDNKETNGEELANMLQTSWMQFDSDSGGWSPDNQSSSIVGGVLAICIGYAILYDIDQASGENPQERVFSPPLPGAAVHHPARQVDLRPFKLKDQLSKHEQLYYSTPALNALAMALNSGDHVILTGPPGSGKTVLAKKIPKLIGKKHLLCTASPDWTTNELIGRYMPVPNKRGDAVLEFEPGFFLQAIESGAWLIIDELNRADIDSCMGPLFSVLSGHRVWLPFKTDKKTKEEATEDETEQTQSELSDSNNESEEVKGNVALTQQASDSNFTVGYIPAPYHLTQEASDSYFTSSKVNTSNNEVSGEPVKWRKIGICLENDKDSLDDNTYWYKVPEDFRIICTMNDSDAGMLNQLSYALQRRFSVIRVEAPDVGSVKNFIEDKVESVYETYTSTPDSNNENNKNLGRKVPDKKVTEKLKSGLCDLFAAGKDKDLMQLRVVGFGQVKDIITMVIEGFSCSNLYKFDKFDNTIIKGLVLTLLANGVVTKVFPQLPAFICNRDEDEVGESFLPALVCIANVFVNNNYFELKEDESKTLTLIAEEKTANNLLDNYLEKELKLLFRNQHVDWRPYWNAAKFYAAATSSGTKTKEEFEALKKRYNIPNSPTIDSIKELVDKVEKNFNSNENSPSGEE